MLKRTQFFKAHQELKGKIVEFFGWELPVQYSGLKKEHLAVRSTGGFFDVSHMGEIFVKGKDALKAVQYITSNNVKKLSSGDIQYSTLPTPNGCIVDDILVYMFNEQKFLLVVNAANVQKDFEWIKNHTREFEVIVKNESEFYSQIAIQGPKSPQLMEQFIQNQDILNLKYYTFTQDKFKDLDSIISRTGYTGEDGFEIYFLNNQKVNSDLFLDIANLGKELGIIPAGLGARDTLRLEAKMSLYGNDIDDSHTILESGLKWILKLKKGDFIGREALLKQKEGGIQKKLVGFEITDRGIARHGYPVYINGKEVGKVTSGTFSPTLSKAIGLTYLPLDFIEPGTEFKIGIRNKEVTAKVVETPFYQRLK